MEKENQSKLNLFDYRDYRVFLEDWFELAKKNQRGFSYRSFAKKESLGSHNFLRMVMMGKRNLTSKSLQQFCKALKLNKQESEFFRNLVFYNQGQDHKEKDFFYRKLVQTRKIKEMKPIEKSQYEFYKAWYHPVVREMINLKNFDGTPEWIAQKIYPKISLSAVHQSLKLLKKLKLVEEEKSNHWKLTENFISTDDEVSSVAVFNYHKNILKMLSEHMSEVDYRVRDISAINCNVSKKLIPVLKKKIQLFRREVLKLISTGDTPEETVLLTIQLFPTSEIKEGVEKVSL